MPAAEPPAGGPRCPRRRPPGPPSGHRRQAPSRPRRAGARRPRVRTRDLPVVAAPGSGCVASSGAAALTPGAARSDLGDSSTPAWGWSADGSGRSDSGRSRWAAASKRNTEPATEALSEATLPRIGMRAMRSTRLRTLALRPRPSEPVTMTMGPRMSASRTVMAGVAVGADDAQAAGVQVDEAGGQVGHGHQQQMLHGSRRGLDRGRADGRSTARREDDAVNATGLSRTQERTHVLGILEVVERQHERRLPPGFGQGQHLVERSPAAWCDHERHALVAVEAADSGDGATLDLDHGDA